MIDYEMIAAREAIGQTAAAIAEVQASHMAIYLTILFAYISLAFLVGKKLTRFQLAIVTLMFVAAAGRQVALIAVSGALIRLKIDHIGEVYERTPASSIIAGSGISIWWPISLWSTGIIASLLFMWSFRRLTTE
jgi:hypothetical protein